jgi:hypothetical protein
VATNGTFVVNVPIHNNGLSQVRSWLVILTTSIGKLIQYHEASNPWPLLVQKEEKKAPMTNYPSSPGNDNDITNTTFPSTPSPKCDNQKSVVETPSNSYGGLPSAVLNCKFSRSESTEYYANKYHHKNGFSYLVSEAFYSGYKAPSDISKQDLVLPSDCIQHFLAQGITLLEFDKIVVDFPICRLETKHPGEYQLQGISIKSDWVNLKARSISTLLF